MDPGPLETMNAVSDTELERMTDKSSRDPAIVALYRDHDFLAAYAKHTDRRVMEDPQQAIGGLWDSYGALQRDFLIGQGLRPHHRLLDFGCGTGRLARAIVRGLEPGNYCGVDISTEALAYAQRLAELEGWADKSPHFSCWVGPERFDYAWAFSVFIHLPSDEARYLIAEVTKTLEPGGKFLFSYVPTDQPDNTRTGLKQFKHPFAFYEKVARGLGHSLKEVKWPGRQRILLMERT